MKVDFRSCDDWVVMYIDNKKVLEGHSLQIAEVLEALGISATYEDAAIPEHLRNCNVGWDYDIEFGETLDNNNIIWYNDPEYTDPWEVP
jgi:hypothetical protein